MRSSFLSFAPDVSKEQCRVVIPEMGKDIVYLYKNGVAEPQEITIGIRTESRVQVLQGLNVGDTLITSGVMQLRTGMKVPIDNLTE